ncbi:hypothetical protein CFP56_033797 [Quercus suber]|uniref:Uncharacterized protein n=1 Tax=Quercus suber TaxID=58331 RepID=A0AAW0LRN8_QUESU
MKLDTRQIQIQINSRYLEHMSGPVAIQCHQNFGLYLHFLPSMQCSAYLERENGINSIIQASFI